MRYDQGDHPTLSERMSSDLNTPPIARSLYKIFDYTKGTHADTRLHVTNSQLTVLANNGSGEMIYPFLYTRLDPDNSPQETSLDRGVLYDIPLDEHTQCAIQMGEQEIQLPVSARLVPKMIPGMPAISSGLEWVLAINGRNAYKNSLLPLGRESSGIAARENTRDGVTSVTLASIAQHLGGDTTVSRYHALALFALDQTNKPHLLLIDTSSHGTKVIFPSDQE